MENKKESPIPGIQKYCLNDEAAGTVQNLDSQDLNQNFLDGTQPSIIEVGSAEKLAENVKTMDTPSTEGVCDCSKGVLVHLPPVKVTPDVMDKVKALIQRERDAGSRRDRLLINEVAGTVQTVAWSGRVRSDLIQNSLDGTQPSISEVGSAEKFTENDKTKHTPSKENTGYAHNGHESRQVEDAKENGDSVHDANGTEEEDHLVKGKNGEAEADSTEVNGVVGEKRKSIGEVETPTSLTPKKARSQGTEEMTDAFDAPTNGDSAEAVVA